MQLVCAALADDVDLIGAVTVLGRVVLAGDLELLDGILRQNHSRRIQGLIGIGKSVQCVVVRLRTTSIDADGIARTLAHLALLADRLDRTSSDKKQAQEVAPVQRQLIHLLLAN